MFLSVKNSSDLITIDQEFVLDLIDSHINDFYEPTDAVRIVIDFIVSSKDTTYKTPLIEKIIKPLFKSSGPTSRDYWVKRGWDDNIIDDILKEQQQIRSIFSYKHWIVKGYSEYEAKLKVSEIQKNNFQKCLDKNGTSVFNSYSTQKYIDKGYSKEDAEIKVAKRKLKDRVVQSDEWRLINGWSKEQLSDLSKRKSNSGSKNGMFGRTPDIKAGNGISGLYNGFYFRSSLEYEFLRIHSCSKNIIQCDIPKTKSNYSVVLSDGSTYTPDFIIGDIVYEIKNSFNYSSIKEHVHELIDTYKKMNLNFVVKHDIVPNFELMLADYENGNIQFASPAKYNRFEKQLQKERNENFKG